MTRRSTREATELFVEGFIVFDRQAGRSSGNDKRQSRSPGRVLQWRGFISQDEALLTLAMLVGGQHHCKRVWEGECLR